MVIREIHEAFLSVGCDAVETNTFGANKIVMAEADMLDRVFENNVAAARIAREACDKFEAPDKPKYVVGSIGPGTKLLVLGQTDWATMFDSYREQVRGLLAGGVDVLLIETQQDMLAIKCCIAAANDAMREAKRRVPIMVQASFDTNNGQQMLTGSDPSALVATFLRTTKCSSWASTARSARTSSPRARATSRRTGRGWSARCRMPACRSWWTARAASR
jgi:5-methyltetrahydrofolate--homocysteine methyltransferase